jgi:hypothetical protein
MLRVRTNLASRREENSRRSKGLQRRCLLAPATTFSREWSGDTCWEGKGRFFRERFRWRLVLGRAERWGVDCSSCLVREPGAEPSPTGPLRFGTAQLRKNNRIRPRVSFELFHSLAHLGLTPTPLCLARCSASRRPAEACNCLLSDDFSIPDVVVLSAPACNCADSDLPGSVSTGTPPLPRTPPGPGSPVQLISERQR